MDNHQKEQVKKAVRDLASHTEKAAFMAKDKLSQQMEQENVKKAADAAAKGARHASAGVTAFWKRLSRRGRIVVVVTVAVIVALIILFLLGISSTEVPDNVLDYLGTKENVVYQTYDKKDFADASGLKFYEGVRSTLPFILIEHGEVTCINLDENTKKSFHMNGLHIGDSISHMKECIQKMNGIGMGQQGNTIAYACQYKGKEVDIMIEIRGNSIVKLQVLTSP